MFNITSMKKYSKFLTTNVYNRTWDITLCELNMACTLTPAMLRDGRAQSPGGSWDQLGLSWTLFKSRSFSRLAESLGAFPSWEPQDGAPEGCSGRL